MAVLPDFHVDVEVAETVVPSDIVTAAASWRFFPTATSGLAGVIARDLGTALVTVTGTLVVMAEFELSVALTVAVPTFSAITLRVPLSTAITLVLLGVGVKVISVEASPVVPSL